MLGRYFEAFGSVRKALSVVKRRTGRHETTVRELRVSREGIEVGDVLREFQGLLSARLTYMGAQAPLMPSPEPEE